MKTQAHPSSKKTEPANPLLNAAIIAAVALAILPAAIFGAARCYQSRVDSSTKDVEVEAPAPLHRYIAAKGSITVDGVSLTVNAVEGQVFSLNIIPHTWDVTTLGRLKVGDPVNLEIDMLARYLARWQETA